MILEELDEAGLRPACIKPNSAFFEQYGVEGFQALFETVEAIHSRGIPVLLDAKRGDIGKTAKAYARFVFDELGVEAVTVNPYLGWDSLEPFLEYSKKGKGIYVLVKTSNAGSQDFQELSLDGKPLYMHVLDHILDDRRAGICAVVGGTHPEVVREVLETSKAMDFEIPLLIPGIGAQGASIDPLRELISSSGSGLHRINASSSILYAWENSAEGPRGFAKASRQAFEELLNQFKLP